MAWFKREGSDEVFNVDTGMRITPVKDERPFLRCYPGPENDRFTDLRGADAEAVIKHLATWDIHIDLGKRRSKKLGTAKVIRQR